MYGLWRNNYQYRKIKYIRYIFFNVHGGLNLVGEIYDYMLGIVIVGIIFVAAMFTIPSISFMNLRQVDQQQLRNTGLNLFNAILLGEGSPANWGSIYPFDQNNTESFGLSLSAQPSLYTIDIDKLQRLNAIGPGQIEYEKVKELLGLQDYGFLLSLYRPFSVNWTIDINKAPANPLVDYSVVVNRNLDQRPILDAQVSVTLLVVAKNPNVDDPLLIVKVPGDKVTNAIGVCQGSEEIEILASGYELDSAMGIFRITVAGITTLVVAYSEYNIQNIINVNTFGDEIVLSFRNVEDTNTSAVRRPIDIFTFDFDEELNHLFHVPNNYHITHGIGYETWNRTFPGLSYLDPGLLIFTVDTTLGTGGRSTYLITGPLSLWSDSEVLTFGSSGDIGDVNVRLRRYVVDTTGMVYNAELLLWKE